MKKGLIYLVQYMEMKEVEVPNINEIERRKRLRGGLFALGLGLVILVALLVMDVDPWWRLILFPFFTGGMSGVFQWRDKT